MLSNWLNSVEALNQELGIFSHLKARDVLIAEVFERFGSEGLNTEDPLQTLFPIGIKDNVLTADMPTRFGSNVHVPASQECAAEGPAVQRLRGSGGWLIGKTVLSEFARSGMSVPDGHTQPRNPWDLARWPGGSSTGSASGVSVGVLAAGLGTDTGGSIRLPAAYCGVIGLMLPRQDDLMTGVFPVARTADRLGVLAATPERLRRIAAMLGFATDSGSRPPLPGTSTAGPLSHLRFAVVQPPHHAPSLTRGVSEHLMADIADVLTALGARTQEQELEWLAMANAASEVIISSECLALHHPLLRTQWDTYHPDTRANIAIGGSYTGADYVAAKDFVARDMTAAFAALTSEVDCIVTPTTPTEAPELHPAGAPAQSNTDGPRELIRSYYLRAWNLLPTAALTIPVRHGPQGMPLGIQLVVAEKNVPLLFDIVEALASGLEFAVDRRPPHFATSS